MLKYYTPYIRAISLFFFVTIIFFNYSNAQKAKSKNLSFYLQNYPNRTINYDKYSTYSLQFGSTSNREKQVKYIKNGFKIPNLEEATSEEADLKISFRLEPIKIGEWEMVEKVDEERGTKSYHYKVNYFAPLKYYFIPNPGRNYMEVNSALLDTITVWTGNSFEKNLLKSSYSKKDLEDRVYKDYVEKINEFFKETYGTKSDKYFLDYFIAKGRKLDYDKINDFYKPLKKDILGDDIKYSLNEKAKEKISNQIKYLESELKNAELENEDARINKEVFNGLNFNLAVLHSLVNDFNKAWLYFDLVKDEISHYEIDDLHEFLLSYQTNYISSSKEDVNFNDVLKGKWVIEKILISKKTVLNDVVVERDDLLKQDEYSCFSDMTFEFDGSRIFKFNEVDTKNCTTEEVKKQWKVRTADDSSIMQFGLGDVGYIDDYFTIIRINHEELIFQGYSNIDPNSDTTSDVIYHFVKK